MSVNINDNNSKDKEEKLEEITEPKIDYKRISLSFVDSIFTQISPTITKKDPLNTNLNDSYLPQQKKEIPTLKNTSEKGAFSNIPKKENQEGSNNISITEKKAKINIKNKSRTKKQESNERKNNNYGNSYMKRLLMNTTSLQNITKYKSNNKVSTDSKNKDINNTHIKFNVRNLNHNNGKAYSSINENYKAKIESDKEKKLYQEKVRLLENRILALKKHEDIIHRRVHCNDIRQAYLNNLKKERSDMKQALLSKDIDKRNELDLKRKHIKEQKKSLNKHLRESMEKSKLIKMKDYENMKKEKKLALSIIKDNKKKFKKYSKGNVNKIKKEREQFKKNEKKKFNNLEKSADNFYLETCEDNKNETIKLKNKLKKLEKLEMKYMNSLNKTRQGLLRNNSQGIYLYKKDMIPITKLDLDKQMEKPFSDKDKTKILYKRNHKNSASVDNLNKYYNKDSNVENKENDKEKEIKEDKID